VCKIDAIEVLTSLSTVSKNGITPLRCKNCAITRKITGVCLAKKENYPELHAGLALPAPKPSEPPPQTSEQYANI
jgi:hypothetical protein